jgi:hypothetical protein
MGATSTIYANTTENIIRRIGDAAVEFIIAHHLPIARGEDATQQIKDDVFAVLMGRNRGLDPEARSCQFSWIEDALLDLGAVDSLKVFGQKRPEPLAITYSGLLGLPCPECGSCYDSSLPRCPYCERHQRLGANTQRGR